MMIIVRWYPQDGVKVSGKCSDIRTKMIFQMSMKREQIHYTLKMQSGLPIFLPIFCMILKADRTWWTSNTGAKPNRENTGGFVSGRRLTEKKTGYRSQ